LHVLALRLQKTDAAPDLRVRRRADEALGLLPRRLRGAGDAGVLQPVLPRPRGRDQHTELPAHPVLAGRTPVGVEQVALVEDRVGDGAAMLEASGDRDRLALPQGRTPPPGGIRAHLTA